MSRFFPHSTYAEDQPLSHTLLWSHVLYRGFQTGSTLGLSAAALSTSYQAFRKSLVRGTFLATSLRFSGVGALAGTALMVPATIARMNGREEIEWKDRSWRLLENRGQVEVDDWSLVGMVGGVLGMFAREHAPGGVVRVVGGAGAGSLVGVVGYMIWRHGVNGGKWPEAK